MKFNEEIFRIFLKKYFPENPPRLHGYIQPSEYPIVSQLCMIINFLVTPFFHIILRSLKSEHNAAFLKDKGYRQIWSIRVGGPRTMNLITDHQKFTEFW